MSRLWQFLRSVPQRYRGESLFALATLLTPAIGLLGNLVAARFVSPVEMGVVQAVMLAPTYLVFLHGGVFSGLQRNLPFFKGRNDDAKIQRMTDASWRTAKLTALAGSMISLLLAIWFWIRGYTSLHLWSILAALLTLGCSPFITHLDVVYRSSMRFGRAAGVLTAGNLVALGACILPAFFGVFGFIARHCLTVVSALAVRLSWNPLPARAQGTWPEVKELARVGLPLMIGTQVYALFNVADRSVVAAFMDDEAMGHFTLASLVATGLHVLPGTVAMILYPRVAHRYGVTGQASSLRKFFWVSLGLGLLVLVPSALAGWALIDPFTRAWFPEYVPGVPAAQITSLSSLAFVYVGTSVIISTLRKNVPYLVAIGMCLALVWGLGGWLVRRGHGLEGVACARLIGTLILCAFSLGYTWWLTADQPASNSSPHDPV